MLTTTPIERESFWTDYSEDDLVDQMARSITRVLIGLFVAGCITGVIGFGAALFLVPHIEKFLH